MIGLISDTHSLLREEVLNNLIDCELIIHTGDIGKSDVISKLNEISDVEFIRGNCDKDERIAKEDKIIKVYNTCIYLIHDISKINIDLKRENINIIIYGHSHKASIYEKNDILYINPGSVGLGRFNLPISMAKLKILDCEDIFDEIKEVNKNVYRYKNYEIEFVYI